MVQQVVSEKQKELLQILELAKEGEQKIQEISEIATKLAQKCQIWYEEGMAKKEERRDSRN